MGCLGYTMPRKKPVSVCTGGAVRPLQQERHFSDASSFHSGVSRGRRSVERQARAGLAAVAFHFQPAEAAVEASAGCKA
jgi:hypothetical protein